MFINIIAIISKITVERPDSQLTLNSFKYPILHYSQFKNLKISNYRYI
jgi:hypothetical protein